MKILCLAPENLDAQGYYTCVAFKLFPVILLLLISFPNQAQTEDSKTDDLKYDITASLNQAEDLLHSHFPAVYMNGLGIDAEEWEQSITLNNKNKTLEYRRRPYVEGNTKNEWFATFIIPLKAITKITEEHKGHTFTIHTGEGEIVSYNFDQPVAKSSTLVINMRDLDRVRNLAERVYSRINHFVTGSK